MERKKALVIINPKAGKNDKRGGLYEALGILSEEYELIIKTTAYGGHATKIAADCPSGCGLVIACGGDGTLNETINGLMTLENRPLLGYIPVGSTNDLAHTIGIPDNAAEAAELILSGKRHKLDIGKFNDTYYTYIACFGPGTSVSYSTPQSMKNKLGYSAYMINGFVFNVVPTLKAVKPKHIKIEYDGQVLEDDFYFGSVSNSVSVAGMFKFSENDVRLNDGRFELMLVRRLENPMEFFPMFKKIKEMDYDGDKLLYLKASEVKMTFDAPDDWSIDGEYGGKPFEADIKVCKEAIDIFSCDGPLFD